MQGWRWMFGLALVPAAIFALGMFFCRNRPRWLVRRGRSRHARARSWPASAARSDVDAELQEIEQQLRAVPENMAIGAICSVPRLRPALIVGIGLAIFQQVTGINTVIYYAPMIIQSAGISSASGAILTTAGIGAVNVLMTIVSMWLIDRIGRRPLLLTGIAGMVVTLGVLGWAFHSASPSGALSWLAVISMMVYVASFAISLGPIFWLLIAEIYPLKFAVPRRAGGDLQLGFEPAGQPDVSDAVGGNRRDAHFLALWICAIGAWMFSYYLVPETKGHTLEEIEAFWRK